MLQQLKLNISQKVKIPDDQFELFAEKVKETTVKKKQLILRPGEVCRYASFVVKGAMRSYLVNDKGEEKTIQLGIEDWWMVDHYSFFSKTASQVTIEAIEETQLLQMTYDDLESIFDKAPMVERFIRLMALNAFFASQKRLMDMMTNTVDNRYEHFIEKYPHFFSRFPQYMIASYLNVTPEHLSAVRARMAKK
jgi:CRP-like cAMP-binding protein